MVSVRRSLAVAACLPLLVATSAGCGGEGRQPAVADPPPSGVASPSPPEPTAREPWEVRSKAGAVAFVEHWVEVFNEAGATGETGELRALSSKSCHPCMGYAGQIDELYGTGGRIESNGWVIEGIGVADRVPLEQLSVGLQVLRSPELIVNGDGKRQRFPGGLANYSAEPRWRKDAWTLASLVNVS